MRKTKTCGAAYREQKSGAVSPHPLPENRECFAAVAPERPCFAAVALVLAGLLLLNALAVGIAAADEPSAGGEPWTYQRMAPTFDRSGFTDPKFVASVKKGGTLAGVGDSPSGYVDYDFSVPRSGWYELFTIGWALDVEFIVDPAWYEAGKGGAYFYGVNGNFDKFYKFGNAWLTEGPHTLRIQRYSWTGFPNVSGFLVRTSPAALGESMRADQPPELGHTYAIGRCPQLSVEAGGRSSPTTLTVSFRLGNAVRAAQSVHIDASPAPKVYKIPMYCKEEGYFQYIFAEGAAGMDWRDMRPGYYGVIDTRTLAPAPGEAKRTPVEDIDCAAADPRYAGGRTRPSDASFGDYRESGDTGFQRWERVANLALRNAMPAPDWFAYPLPALHAHTPYMVDIDYPDDALRTFSIALRESQPLAYPVAGGVDSGGEYSLSHAMQRARLIFWPRSDAPRIAFQTVHDGRRAACASIHVSRIDGPLPPPTAQKGERLFLNWYEEGMSFMSMYGGGEDFDPAARIEAIQRWAQSARYMGVTTLMPTVAVYNFALYPSQYNRAFSIPDRDVLREMMVVAEEHGLSVIPELHPRADEAAWKFAAAPDPKPNLLVNKDGATDYYAPDGKTRNVPPHYNPLYPDNQRWYLGMIGELADRYKDSPAFTGVSLRLMQWSNPTLNNFDSLDWGYDDFTVGLFVKETGTKVPGPLSSPDGRVTPQIAQARYQWIMANAREAWIAWRCRKIAELYTRIRDRLRQARPDLKLYTTIHPRNYRSDPAGWREAGVEVRLLGAIDGVVPIDASYYYGRGDADVSRTQPLRDALIDPAQLTAYRAANRQGAFLSGAYYLEQTEAVLPPAAIGFTANTRLTWTSGVGTPAGRHALERYALQLAETDATVLGDGGNGYSLGQPPLRDWMAEYHQLPARPFTPLADGRDPVAAWTLQDGDNFWLYLVNRERYPLTVTFALTGASAMTRPATGEAVASQGGQVRIPLEAYALQVYRGHGTGRIADFGAHAPDDAVKLAENLVRGLEDAARNPLRLVALSAAQRGGLEQGAREARQALNAGHLWRARTIVETWPVQSCLVRMKSVPPGLRQDQ
jgi:hypothetical protein